MKSKIVLVFGFLLCLIPYALLYGIPVYLLGAFFLIKSDEKRIAKISWISITLFLLVLVYIILILYIEKMTGERFTL